MQIYVIRGIFEKNSLRGVWKMAPHQRYSEPRFFSLFAQETRGLPSD